MKLMKMIFWMFLMCVCTCEIFRTAAGQPNGFLNLYPQHFYKKAIVSPPFTHHYIQNCELNICREGEIDHYPTEIIRSLVRDKKALKQLKRFILNQTIETEVAGRSGIDYNTMPLCRVRSYTTVPLVMRNHQYNWRYIVNIGADFQQHFFIEACQEDGHNMCEDYFGSPVENDSCSRTCQQQFQEVTLLVYTNGTLEYDKFKIPTTCKCSCTNCEYERE